MRAFGIRRSEAEDPFVLMWADSSDGSPVRVEGEDWAVAYVLDLRDRDRLGVREIAFRMGMFSDLVEIRDGKLTTPND